MDGLDNDNVGDNELDEHLLDDDMDDGMEGNMDNSNNKNEDEQDIELPEEDEMPENHHKMAAFQIAIRAVLQRQIEKLQIEVNESNRLVSIGSKESEEAAKSLHDEQKCLVLEEDNVRVAAKKLQKTQNRRENREKENRQYRTEVDKSDVDIEQRIVHNEGLRSTVNDLTGQSLHYQLQRLDVENQVGVDQACTDKGEQDFKLAQEAKQFQDKYIGL